MCSLELLKKSSFKWLRGEYDSMSLSELETELVNVKWLMVSTHGKMWTKYAFNELTDAIINWYLLKER